MSLRENALNIYTSCLEKLEPRKRVYDYLSSLKTSIVDCDKIFPVAFGKAAFSMMDSSSARTAAINKFSVPVTVTTGKERRVPRN